MRRATRVAGAALLAVALLGGGWFAARAFTSPAQWEAQATPPAPRPVLAEVTQGDLIDERMLGASIVPRSQFAAAIVPSANASRSIVTESPLSVRSAVSVGSVLLRVNGQPVFALESAFPFYRDLGIGDSGPDVAALQRNLVTLGLLSRADGSFGSATARAVSALYRDAHAAAPTRPAVSPPGDATAPPAEGETTASAAATPYLPLSASIAVPSLPATLAKVPSVGTDVSTGTQLEFAAEEAVLRLSVDPGLADSLVVGAVAACRIGDAEPAPCRVTRIFEGTATSAGIGEGDQVMTWADLALDAGAVDAAQAGVRATVDLQVATLATDTLLVPASALAQQSEGSGSVLRQEEDGSFRTVRVDVLASLDGTLAVTGELKAGDLLRVDR